MLDTPECPSADREYLNLVNRVLTEGREKGDRTGTGTISVFGHQMRFDLSDNKIPMLTTKKMFTRGIIRELLWYIQGNTNINYLLDHDVHIWDEWADDKGDLGPVYGKQWRSWEYVDRKRRYSTCEVEHFDQLDHVKSTTYFDTDILVEEIDQLAHVIETLKTNPNDRRMIVCSWNVGQLSTMALPPCHLLFQFYSIDGELSCQLYQRSCDVGLGVPFNIVQYSILTHMIAQVTGHTASEFVWTGGDVHIYQDHKEQLAEQLTRDPYPSPTLWLNPNITNIDDFRYEDFKIEGYQSHPTIKMDVSV
jgi:thymidylate synthase